jgi:hypothetical protein
MWRCQCACGVQCDVRGDNLESGCAKSCGCLSRERASVVARENFAARIKRNTQPAGAASAYGLFTSYSKGATLRGLPFTLSQDLFLALTSSDCVYCGIAPHRRYGRSSRSNGRYLYNGIDRVDNTQGYTEANSVPCCADCNRAKRVATVTDFLAWVERIHNHQAKVADASRAS